MLLQINYDKDVVKTFTLHPSSSDCMSDGMQIQVFHIKVATSPSTSDGMQTQIFHIKVGTSPSTNLHRHTLIFSFYIKLLTTYYVGTGCKLGPT